MLVSVKGLLARFQVAEMLRVVGTARDERIVQLGLKVQPPAWLEIDQGIRAACDTFDIEEAVFPQINTLAEGQRLAQAYTALRNIARHYDDASRTAG